MAVEGEGDGEAGAGAENLATGKIGRDFEDGGALGGETELGFSRGIEEVGLVVSLDAESEVDVAVAVEGAADGVDVLGNFLPAGGDDDLFVGAVVTVFID